MELAGHRCRDTQGRLTNAAVLTGWIRAIGLGGSFIFLTRFRWGFWFDCDEEVESGADMIFGQI